MTAFPKPHTPRDKRYLAHLRTLPCIFCGKPPPSEASHHGRHGWGQKASDYLALPACSNCHRRHHSRHSSPIEAYDDLTQDEKRSAYAALAAVIRADYLSTRP